MRRLLTISLAVLALGAAPASAAFEDPLFVFSPSEAENPAVPDFEGPCGAAVDALGNFYVSDYYHRFVDVFEPDRDYIAHAKDVDPLSGPCGIAVDAAGGLYVNSYHRHVEKLVPSSFPPVKGSPFPFVPATTYASAGTIDSDHPTGVAVDPVTGNVYVDARTHVAVYDPSGAPVLDGGEPLRLGEGSLGAGYGVAVSRFPATAGRVYVPDAADGAVEVYDPAIDPDDPVATIDGSGIPGGGFGSLRDSAVAVDDVSGDVYVADTLGPQFSEQPKATIQVFDSSGAYQGRLKHDVIDGSPVGLAVDNSATATQGRVYVTSGNSEGGVLYAYPPDAAGIPPSPPLSPFAGVGAGTSSSAAATVTPPPSPRPAPTAQASEVTQKGTLRIKVAGRLSPRALPRNGTAPVAVSVGGEIETTDESPPPQLERLRIELNRHGQLESRGLPTCVYDRIQPASSTRALAACRGALVGTGRFAVNITLAGQEPYPARGRLLIFNGRKGGKPVLFGHIYSPRPFASSFVIVFAIKRASRGPYGTTLNASLPAALGNWGNLTAIEMTLKRQYTHRGRSRSYVSAGCPAPKGFPGALFPLARTSFSFAGGNELQSVLIGECKVKG